MVDKCKAERIKKSVFKLTSGQRAAYFKNRTTVPESTLSTEV